MARLTYCTGIDVRRTSACSRDTIVAAHAVISDRTVIYRGTQPTSRDMANITFLGGRNMQGTLAGCGNVVMTTGTGARHLGMVNCSNRYPCRGYMTGCTVISGGDMGWTFTCRL